MTTYTIAAGYDTTAFAVTPTDSLSQTAVVTAETPTTGAGFLYLPLPDIAGTTIASATLTGHAFGSYSAQTLSLAPITSVWAASTLNWNRQPTVGALVGTAVSAGVNGAAVNLTATSIIQAVASGAAWYGVRITSTGFASFNSFDSGLASWTLTIETTTAPEAPQNLVPNGTTVGSGAPILTCDFSDNGGLSNDMAGMNVQVNTTSSFTSPAYDQTDSTLTVPVFDLSTHSFSAITSGSTRFWRARVRDSDSNWSAWSDVASFTFRTQPTITLNSPSAGVLADPTSTILATTSTNMSAYRVQITDGTDRTSIRYDTGRLPANPAALTTVSVALPEENDDGQRILVNDSNYQLHIRVWDTFTDRQSTPSSPSYVESWSTFHFADDGTVAVPTSLAAAQTTGPAITLTWNRSAAPDAWVVTRDAVIIARLDGPGALLSGTTYQYVDPRPPQWVSHAYVVKAVASGKRSNPSNTASITPSARGIWLYTQAGQKIVLDGLGVDQFTVNDRRTIYKPINLRYDVDILTGFEGLSGNFAGTFPSDIDPTQNVLAVQAILLSIKENPSQYVYLVYGLFAGRVLLRNVSITPDPSGNPAVPLMRVSFGINQVGDFDGEI